MLNWKNRKSNHLKFGNIILWTIHLSYTEIYKEFPLSHTEFGKYYTLSNVILGDYQVTHMNDKD